MKTWTLRYCSRNLAKINCFEKCKCIVHRTFVMIIEPRLCKSSSKRFLNPTKSHHEMRFVTEQGQIVAASPSVPPVISIIPPMLHIDSFIYHQRSTRTILGNDSTAKQHALKIRRIMDVAVPWDFSWWV